jgi:hypothetical protein
VTQEFAKKVIKFTGSANDELKKKHIRDTHAELKCYMTLDHPHIIIYVHHLLSKDEMEIYTEFCQERDLGFFLRRRIVYVALSCHVMLHHASSHSMDGVHLGFVR